MKTRYTVDHTAKFMGEGKWNHGASLRETYKEALDYVLSSPMRSGLHYRIVKITETPGPKVFRTEHKGPDGPVLGATPFPTEAEAIQCAITSTGIFNRLYRVVALDGPPVITREVV